ncbi:MAG: PP2C family protein-serine/threonine phosphatase [Ignavibacteria bacterium]|nr:PP2C family protein-serine/threonine phosphatase [Ignavibacteria bacterium]
MNSSSLINLESLLELSARLNESNDEEFILNSTLLTLMGKLRIVRACALLPDLELTTFEIALAKGRINIESVRYFELRTFRELDTTIPSEQILLNSGYVYGIPICYHHSLLAGICLGKPLLGALTSEERHYASLVCTIAANALQNARSTQSLLRSRTQIEIRNQLVTAMFEMSREFSTVLSKDQILKMFSYRLMGQLMVSRFSMFLRRPDDIFEVIINRLGVEIPQDFLREFAGISLPTVTEYIPTSHDIKEFTESHGIKVISQMMIQGEVKGVLVVGRKMHGELYSRDNISFIEALGNTTISALENARLFQEEVNKKRLESELALAHDIQTKLLPGIIPSLPGFDLAAASISSKQVGGDYYDFIQLSTTEMLIAIADVSGKGMPASLLMANVQAALRVLAPLRLDLPDMVERINAIIYQNTGADKFITFFCGIIDSDTGQFAYINAGHNPPMLLRKDKSIHELKEGGIILGILDTPPPYRMGYTIIERGETLLLYTDGVSEAMNPKDEEFGEAQTTSFLREFSSLPAVDIVDKLIEAVQYHAGIAPQSDDITLAIIKRN